MAERANPVRNQRTHPKDSSHYKPSIGDRSGNSNNEEYDAKGSTWRGGSAGRRGNSYRGRAGGPKHRGTHGPSVRPMITMAEGPRGDSHSRPFSSSHLGYSNHQGYGTRGTLGRGGFAGRRGGSSYPVRGGPLHRGAHGTRYPDERAQRQTFPMGMTMLRRLADTDPSETVHLLYANRTPLEKLLEEKTIDENRMSLLFGVLAKLCTGSSDQHSKRIEDILLLIHETSFVNGHLTQWIATWPSIFTQIEPLERNILSLLNLLTRLFHVVPDTIPSIGVVLLLLKHTIASVGAKEIHISSDVKAKLESLVEKHAKCLRDWKEMTARRVRRPCEAHETPPDDFRDLPILPIPSELRSDYKPFLRKNVVNGTYRSVHDYLDTHFRLLREDFVQPLRDGIAEYVTEVAEHGRKIKKRFQNFRLYNNVRATCIVPSSSGLTYMVKFELERHLKNVKWDISKRLIFGSLVCLSRNNFKSLIFGVVANRDTEKINNGFIEIAFDIEPDQSHELFSFPFVMAESSSYFEAYRHVLGCLQNIDQEKFPFAKYLIETSQQPVLPEYIHDDCTFDMSSVVTGTIAASTDETSAILNMTKAVRVDAKTGWPDAGTLGLDDSQMSAYQAAFQEEVCLIQGPPGTGKTYVGLKIVKTLLENKKVWSDTKPILVVCYTNHALDQFLEGILEFEPHGIVRIGGRSQSEQLKELNLNQLRRRLGRSKGRQYGLVRGQMAACAAEIEHYTSLKDAVGENLVKFHALRDVMTRVQYDSLSYNRFRIDPTLAWLPLTQSAEFHPPAWQPKGEQSNERDTVAYDEDRQVLEIDDSLHVLADDEFERRYLDDEDDFIRPMNALKQHHPRDIILNPSHFDEQPKDGWNVQGRQKHGKPNQFVRQQIKRKDSMTEREARRVRDVWCLGPTERWRLYRYWIKEYLRNIHRELHDHFSTYGRLAAVLKELRVEEDLKAIEGRTIIGVTTTGAAKYNKLLRGIGPPIVIVEEAAEILEAHVITSITEHTEHLILIGDHQQLRPNPTVYQLCRDFKLDVSLFERLIRNGMFCHRLSLQHRMRPEISNILRLHDDFYPGLLDHDMVKNYDNVLGLEKDVFFVDHEIPEQHDDENKSRSNLHEANFITSLSKYLLQQGYRPDQITILTAYKGQVWNLKRIMNKKTFEGVRVCPVDNFQGEENDIILFSFVRSNDEGSIGFLKVSNRVCVALSRAKIGLYCIGNFSLMSQKSDLWKTITTHLRENGLIGSSLRLYCGNHPATTIDASSAKEFKDAPDGGCTEPCTARLNCGHTCGMKCHPADKEHIKVLCKKPCETMMCSEHKCPLLCFQECGSLCMTRVQKTLPCNHVMWAACHVRPEKVECTHPCEKDLACGHQCRNQCREICTQECQEAVQKSFEPCGHTCGVPCYQTKCQEPCSALLKCEHKCRGKCGECLNGRYHKTCYKTCKRILVCGHVCGQSPCMPTCPPCTRGCENRCQHNKCINKCGESCVPCREKCKWKCRHEKCTRPCGDQCDRRRCNEPCKRLIEKCRHKCIGLCGERCPKLCRFCDKEEVTTILFGTEDEVGARFVQLEDCPHIVEVSAMDKLMGKTDDVECDDIKLPECPWCKTPIRNNQRYNNRIKAQRADVELVKRRIKGAEMNIRKEKDSVKRRLSAAQLRLGIGLPRRRGYGRTELEEDNLERPNRLRVDRLRVDSLRVDTINTPEKNKWRPFFSGMEGRLLTHHISPSMTDLLSANVLLDMYEQIRSLQVTKEQTLKDIPLSIFQGTVQYIRFESGCELLEERLMSIGRYVSEQEVGDWGREHLRCRHTLSLLHVITLFRKSGQELHEYEKVAGAVEEAESILSDGHPFTEDKEMRTRNLLKELKDLNPLLLKVGISEGERKMIVKAMGFSSGHWFKCQKGHIYAIGDCGGANQRGQCPECKTTIGGEQHRLEKGNKLASEMDGARFAAYSEEANNMANFNLDGLV